ncbi:RNA polymerase sigma-70 factor [Crossiella sp. CA198]|uniref:RNA polymerase sigma-70 factor n=1 Tax=Crossiella sp. CA198 TaxID=3455607 RepID=UPI003F8D4592
MLWITQVPRAGEREDFAAMPETANADLDQASAVFTEVRPRLFGIAYRMLGSAQDAEDLVQEVWLRWQTCDRAAVLNPAAYLATATTRLAINAGRSAKTRHETYPGQWLPEPIDTTADPQLGAEADSALELAVLLLLEKLTPTQRAAYVLREAFGYPYPQIAEIIQATETSARQLVSRARRQLAEQRRTPASAPEQRRLLTAFVAAAREGDLLALEELFAADVVSYSDGGGVARAARIPVRTAPIVAKFVRAFHTRFWVGVQVEWAAANGHTAAVLRRDGETFAMITVAASAEGIHEIYWMLNPGKLTGYGANV